LYQLVKALRRAPLPPIFTLEGLEETLGHPVPQVPRETAVKDYQKQQRKEFNELIVEAQAKWASRRKAAVPGVSIEVGPVPRDLNGSSVPNDKTSVPTSTESQKKEESASTGKAKAESKQAEKENS
jgi:hypothetical protein